MDERRTEDTAEHQVDQHGEPLTKVRSEDLFGGKAEILIEHNSATYRLRRTSLGKLILTK
ncbi:MAG: hemin uptake protein HemP [Pseudomonadota bacterium]